MEKLIVALIVACAVYALVRMFKKQAHGETDCACKGKCTQCPSDPDRSTCR